MDLATGAIGSLLSKLLQLLQDEYKLQKGVRAEVESLSRELESMHVALCMVAQMRHDQLDKQVRLWAHKVREASYDMEDILDTFLVRVDNDQPAANADKGKINRLREKMGKLRCLSMRKAKARHGIAGAIEDIKKQVDEIAKLRDRYRVHVPTVNLTPTTSTDPRPSTPYTKASELVGIDQPRDVLIKMLFPVDDGPSHKEIVKIVSVVGSGGLGKTTLAKAVYDKLTVEMNICYKAFVTVGQNPDVKKVLRDVLRGLDKEYYTNKINYFITLDESQLIEDIREFLREKRYFIVIDDIWDVSSWNKIKPALQQADDNDFGSKVIITTRCNDVAKKVRCSYKMEPLGPQSSKILFRTRIFESEDRCPEQLSELYEKILKKCGGVPLAIITIASLLANTSQDITRWQEIYNAIGSGLSSSDYIHNMRKILSLSYYDLSSNVKTCLLYLSIYPEDYEITRDRLIWRWIAEGFIQPLKSGDDLFELGEGYFNELIDRSLLQPVRHIDSNGLTYGCRVHDMILDLICSLAREENFVTILKENVQDISSRSKYRRLSLRNTTWPTTGVSQVRSIAVFSPSIQSMASMSCFDVLRVLDLEGCRLEGSEDRCKLDVGSLIHLRYLGLAGTKLRELPQGIEKLQFLQVLKPGGCELSQDIFSLTQLMCLDRGRFHPRPGNLLGNLASLHVLKSLIVDKNSVDAMEQLGHLTQLWELHIEIGDGGLSWEVLINSLGNLRKLCSLHIVCLWRGKKPIEWERWVPSSHLHTLNLFLHDYLLPTLPKWINPRSLPLLSVLQLELIRNVRAEDIQILGMLPTLCRLILRAARVNVKECPLQRFVVSAKAFPCAKWCRFIGIPTVPSMFPRGAMPMVENITFCLQVSNFISCNSGFDFGDLAMGHLPSLRNVHYDLYYGRGCNQQGVPEVQEALRHAADVHPNRPSIKFSVDEL